MHESTITKCDNEKHASHTANHDTIKPSPNIPANSRKADSFPYSPMNLSLSDKSPKYTTQNGKSQFGVKESSRETSRMRCQMLPLMLVENTRADSKS